MKKPSVREHAELFAEAWQKGYETATAHSARMAAKEASRAAYAKKRVAQLARWRKFAIDRLSIGLKLVAEIDRESKRS